MYGIVDIDLTRLQRVQNQLGPPGDKVSSIYSPPSTAPLTSLATSKV